VARLYLDFRGNLHTHDGHQLGWHSACEVVVLLRPSQSESTEQLALAMSELVREMKPGHTWQDFALNLMSRLADMEAMPAVNRVSLAMMVLRRHVRTARGMCAGCHEVTWSLTHQAEEVVASIFKASLSDKN